MSTSNWRYHLHGLHPKTLQEIQEAMLKGYFEETQYHRGRELIYFQHDPSSVGCQLALKTVKHLHLPNGRPYSYALIRRKYICHPERLSYQLVIGVSLKVIRKFVEPKKRSAYYEVIEHS